MLNLVAATRAGRHDDGSVRLVFDFFDKRPGNFQRKFIFRFQHPERAAMPQQPVSSIITVRFGKRSASRACRPVSASDLV